MCTRRFRDCATRTRKCRRLRDFLCGGERRTPPGPLPSMDPLEAWCKRPDERPARHLARPLHGAARDRRRARAHRSGVGTRASPSRFAGPKRFQPVPVPLHAMPPLDAVRRLARPLRSPRLPDHPRARQARRAVRHLAGRRRAPRGVGRAARADHRARLVGERTRCRIRKLRSPPRRRSISPGAASKAATRRCGRRSSIRAPRHARVLQRRHRPHRPSTPRSANASARSIS